MTVKFELIIPFFANKRQFYQDLRLWKKIAILRINNNR